MRQVARRGMGGQLRDRRHRLADHRDQRGNIRRLNTVQVRVGNDPFGIGRVLGGHILVTDQRHDEIQQVIAHICDGRRHSKPLLRGATRCPLTPPWGTRVRGYHVIRGCDVRHPLLLGCGVKHHSTVERTDRYGQRTGTVDRRHSTGCDTRRSTEPTRRAQLDPHLA
ncbi:Uncharacterised protein [Mycobacteroides abscessus subsp. massiliense]|nr:Uncharacterised protein [Mycobacteroides abscessus subsp. massiliense]